MKNLILAAVLLVPAAAGAQQNIKIGNMDVNPFMGTQETYDSNIYLTKTARRGSSINRSALGFDLLEKAGSRLDLTGGYSMEVLSYSRAAAINNAVHHNANFGAVAKLPKEMTLAVTDKYKQTTDQATSELTQRAQRIENTAGVNIDAPLRGDLGFALVAQHVYNNYMDSAFAGLDREEFLFGADVSYKLQPKTKLFVSYRNGKLTYQTGNVGDATYNNVDLGLTGNIAPKVTGTVTVGMQARKYKNDLLTAKNTGSTMGYTAQVAWKALERTDVTLLGKRANVESTYGISRYYTSTLADLSIARQLNKVKVAIGGSYEGIQYPERTTTASPKRLDENTSARITADYNVQKWLNANAGFTYKNRNSNERVFEYNDKIFSIGIKAMF